MQGQQVLASFDSNGNLDVQPGDKLVAIRIALLHQGEPKDVIAEVANLLGNLNVTGDTSNALQRRATFLAAWLLGLVASTIMYSIIVLHKRLESAISFAPQSIDTTTIPKDTVSQLADPAVQNATAVDLELGDFSVRVSKASDGLYAQATPSEPPSPTSLTVDYSDGVLTLDIPQNVIGVFVNSPLSEEAKAAITDANEERMAENAMKWAKERIREAYEPNGKKDFIYGILPSPDPDLQGESVGFFEFLVPILYWAFQTKPAMQPIILRLIAANDRDDLMLVKDHVANAILAVIGASAALIFWGVAFCFLGYHDIQINQRVMGRVLGTGHLRLPRDQLHEGEGSGPLPMFTEWGLDEQSALNAIGRMEPNYTGNFIVTISVEKEGNSIEKSGLTFRTYYSNSIAKNDYIHFVNAKPGSNRVAVAPGELRLVWIPTGDMATVWLSYEGQFPEDTWFLQPESKGNTKFTCDNIGGNEQEKKCIFRPQPSALDGLHRIDFTHRIWPNARAEIHFSARTRTLGETIGKEFFSFKDNGNFDHDWTPPGKAPDKIAANQMKLEQWKKAWKQPKQKDSGKVKIKGSRLLTWTYYGDLPNLKEPGKLGIFTSDAYMTIFAHGQTVTLMDNDKSKTPFCDHVGLDLWNDCPPDVAGGKECHERQFSCFFFDQDSKDEGKDQIGLDVSAPCFNC